MLITKEKLICYNRYKLTISLTELVIEDIHHFYKIKL